MEPNHNAQYSPGTELPPLQHSEGQVYAHEKAAASPEIGNQQPSLIPSPMASSFVASQQAAPLTSIGSAQATPGSPIVNASTASLTADDADLIEKEWVLKAKALVMQTKDDPRTQSIKMSGVKADYIKKRYNKDLKVSES